MLERAYGDTLVGKIGRSRSAGAPPAAVRGRRWERESVTGRLSGGEAAGTLRLVVWVMSERQAERTRKH